MQALSLQAGLQPRTLNMDSFERDRKPGSALGSELRLGWEAALRESEHQAEHWDTPEHGETGHLIAEALRAAVSIARGGGLDCEHRWKAESEPPAAEPDPT